MPELCAYCLRLFSEYTALKTVRSDKMEENEKVFNEQTINRERAGTSEKIHLV